MRSTIKVPVQSFSTPIPTLRPEDVGVHAARRTLVRAIPDPSMDWGTIKPSYLDFKDASQVRLKRDGAERHTFSAIRILGSGSFEAPGLEPRAFVDGGIFVLVRNQVRLVPHEVFFKNFEMIDGSPIRHIEQIDMSTPSRTRLTEADRSSQPLPSRRRLAA